MQGTSIFLEAPSFVLHENSSAALSDAANKLIRAEERILASPNANTIKRALLRFEALLSPRVVSGRKIEIADFLRIETISQLYSCNKRTNSLLERMITREGFNDEPYLLEAFRFMKTLEWISENVDTISEVLPKTVLEVHRRCLRGLPSCSEAIGFRTEPYIFPPGTPREKRYQAPDPKDIPRLIEDYCEFISKESFCPVAQAALSQYQIESIRPFTLRFDGTEGALSHLVFFKRGLLRSVVAPLTLGPAVNTEAHVRCFAPHQVGFMVADVKDYINSGILFRLSAYYTKLTARAMICFLDTLTKIEALWRSRISKVEKGSALDLLLKELPGMPMVTTTSASKVIGRSPSATNDALNRLREIGLLKQEKPIRKNHVFVAQEALHVLEALENKLISRTPVARDNVRHDVLQAR